MGKYTRRQILTFVTFAIADFCSAVCVSLQAPFYPQEAEKKGATATQYGFVFGIFELTVFLSSPIYGKYLSAIGPSFLFSAGIFTTGTTCVLFGLLDKVNGTGAFVGLSFAIRIVEALGNAAFLTSSFSLIAKEFPDAVGATFATLETCFGLGLIVGPTLGGGLYQVGGYQLPFFCLGCVLIVAAIFTRFVIPSDENVEDDQDEKNSHLFNALKIPAVMIYVYSIVVTAFSIGFLQAVLEPHIRPMKLSPFQTGLMFIINGATYGIFAPIWGVLCDRFVLPRRIVGLGSIMTIVAFLLIGPVPFIPLETTLPICIIALLVHGMGFGAELVGTFSGTQKSAIENGFPNNIDTYGLVSGIWTSTFALGAFLGPTAAGYLYDSIGFKWSTVVVVAMHGLVFCAVMILECCSLFKPTRKDTEADNEREPLIPKKSVTSNNREDNYTSDVRRPDSSPPTSIASRSKPQEASSVSRSYHAVASGLGSFTQPIGMTPRYLNY